MTYSEFTKLADILNESVLADKGYGQTFDKYISCAKLFEHWVDVVGKRFEKISLPYDIKGTTLFVSVMSSVVVQELSLYKKDILKKLEPFAHDVNYTIEDIRFDYKNWLSVKKSIDAVKNPKNESGVFDISTPNYYTEKDFETIGLDNKEKEEFKNLKEILEKSENLPEKLKEKLYNNAVMLCKAQKLRNMERT